MKRGQSKSIIRGVIGVREVVAVRKKISEPNGWITWLKLNRTKGNWAKFQANRDIWNVRNIFPNETISGWNYSVDRSTFNSLLVSCFPRPPPPCNTHYVICIIPPVIHQIRFVNGDFGVCKWHCRIELDSLIRMSTLKAVWSGFAIRREVGLASAPSSLVGYPPLAALFGISQGQEVMIQAKARRLGAVDFGHILVFQGQN